MVTPVMIMLMMMMMIIIVVVVVVVVVLVVVMSRGKNGRRKLEYPEKTPVDEFKKMLVLKR